MSRDRSTDHALPRLPFIPGVAQRYLEWLSRNYICGSSLIPVGKGEVRGKVAG